MDINTLAKSVVDQAIGDKAAKKADPQAVARGKLRTEALTAEERIAVAKKGAAARWRNGQLGKQLHKAVHSGSKMQS